MKKALALTSGTVAVLALPLVSFAATISNVSDAGSFIINIINNVIVPVLFAIAFIVFLWGAFDVFILGSGATDVKEKGKSLMLYGLIGFFVMVSIWGLVNVLTGTISFGNNSGITGGTPKAGVQVGQ
jgi:Type IV secretion system pilin